MKLKDYKGTLGGVRVKTPLGVIGYWKSQWGYPEGKAGVWLSNGKDNKIYPQFVDSLKDCLEWEITEEDINCDILVDMEYTNNCKNN